MPFIFYIKAECILILHVRIFWRLLIELFNYYLVNLKKSFSFLVRSHKSNLLRFKNFFLKKFWIAREIFFCANFSLFMQSIHYPLNSLKLWDSYVPFIIKCRLIPDMQIVNRFFLKNIFFKIFQDVDLWSEIEKMINSNLVGFTNEFIVWVYTRCNIQTFLLFFM